MNSYSLSQMKYFNPKLEKDKCKSTSQYKYTLNFLL